MSEGLARSDPAVADAAESGFDLPAALSFLWRRWKFIVVIVALVFLGGIGFRLYQTPLYTATAEILLDQPREKAPGEGALVGTFDLDAAMIEGQMALIRSTVFLRRVVEREHLAADPKNTAAGRPASSPDTIPPAEMRAIGALKSALEVKRVAQEGFVIAISVTAPDPAQAARLANAVAGAYLVDKLDTRFEAAKRASAWLSDRLVGLRKQLHVSEEAVTAFRAEHGFVESGGATLTQQQLSKLNAGLIDAKADLAQKQAQMALLKRIETTGGSITSLPGIGNTQTLQSLEAQARALSAKEADLLANYTAANPFVTGIRAQLHAQLGAVNHSIAVERARIAAAIRNDYQLAQARVSSLERSLQQATGQTDRDNATAIRLRELERTAAANKMLFEDFLKQAKATEAQSTFKPQNVRIITPAVAPGAPSSPPSQTRFMAVDLFLGLLLGVGGAFVKEKLDGGFKTPQQLKERLGLPLLASVGRLTGRDLRVERQAVPIYALPIIKPLSRFGEAIRSLRSALQMTDVERPPTVIQVASAVPGEGKTTIGLSLAASAAAAKLAVLFIDADLRHATATRILGLQKEPGLVDLLLGEVAIEDVVRTYAQGGYWGIGAGAKTQNPTDLLGSERLKTIITTCKRQYDLVIIDTPPVGPVMDAVVVSHLCDTVILVVKWGATPREVVEASVEQLSGHRNLAGIVFNRVNVRQARKYGRYASAHYYGAVYYKDYIANGVRE
ncbi:MAG TPA: polysaccharide biosynthesis tyrosine autokinase [Stellaceae bacterium]|nr:polysaccharide biosynthesis tyrosine autokinase [Stellaceae bacterium]